MKQCLLGTTVILWIVLFYLGALAVSKCQETERFGGIIAEKDLDGLVASIVKEELARRETLQQVGRLEEEESLGGGGDRSLDAVRNETQKLIIEAQELGDRLEQKRTSWQTNPIHRETTLQLLKKMEGRVKLLEETVKTEITEMTRTLSEVYTGDTSAGLLTRAEAEKLLDTALRNVSFSALQPPMQEVVSEVDVASISRGARIVHSLTSSNFSPRPKKSQENPNPALITDEDVPGVLENMRNLKKKITKALLDYTLLVNGMFRSFGYELSIREPYTSVQQEGTGSFQDMTEVRRNAPEEAISSDLSLGRCWACRLPSHEALGEGKKACNLTVELAEATVPGAFSVQHISKERAMNIDSAPKAVEVYALADLQGSEERLLASFTYDIEQSGTEQVFKSTAGNSSPTKVIKLAITSNHGHPEYVCLYRFRVYHPVG